MESKICSKCQEEKNLTEFSKHKLGRNGLRSQCKSCCNLMLKSYREQFPESIKPKTKEQKIKNVALHKKRYHNDSKWREGILEKKKEYNKRPETKLKIKLQRDRWLLNPANRIAKNLRDRMRHALKNNKKITSTIEITGIDFDQLKIYLESKFQEGMTWENYGEWHIDHIIPCVFFDFTQEDHQKICFYYKNLQPLWAKDNISKKDKICIDGVQDFINEIKKDLNLAS